jgi:MtN3 and saliva related transmembrane protein
MSWIDLIGVGAGLLSMISFIPQIAKIWREKNASGVSLRTYALTVSAFALWLTYGLLSGTWPVAAANAVCLTLSAMIVALRLRFGDGPAPA